MRIAVIGAGPAGLFGAIAAASSNRDCSITVYEASDHALEKVRISGGGRCNVTNRCSEPELLVKNYPRGARELLGPFHHFGPKETVEWFKKHDVKLKAEPDGRMFPITDSSSTIIQCLLDTCANLNIIVRYNESVRSVEVLSDSTNANFDIVSKTNEHYDCLLIATGSSPVGHKLAASLGHDIVDTVPSLFTFKVKDKRLETLSGLSFPQVEATLVGKSRKKIKQVGPVLITHWGLSGPAVLKLSAWGARELFDSKYKAKLFLNLVPNISSNDVADAIARQREIAGKKQVASEQMFAMPKRYWKSMLEYIKVPAGLTWSQLDKKMAASIVSQLVRAEFDVRGKGVFKEEFVTCGGVGLKQIDFKSMQSKVCPSLYFAGEVLNIDGITGGFNFQNSWTTGYIAGSHMAS